LFPAAGYVEMILAAAAEVYGTAEFAVESLVFERPLVLTAERRPVQVSLVTADDMGGHFEMASRAEGDKEWVRFAHGKTRQLATAAPAGISPATREPKDGYQPISPIAHYASMRDAQIDYGPAFRGVEEIAVKDGRALGRVKLPAQAGEAAS